MKFARHLAEEGNEPELHSLYKQLKKSLRIFEGPADAGSTVDVPHTLPSSDDEDEEAPEAGPSRVAAATANGGTGTVQPTAVQQAGAVAAVQPMAVQQGAAAGQPAQGVPQQLQAQPVQPRRPDPEQEARFVALVEQCVQQLNEDYLAREEMLVIKADLAQQACAAAHSRAEQLEAYTSIVNVHGELVLLCHWSMCAYTGIVKILKKHHKRTGQRVHSALLANLMSQPFCCLEEIRGLVRQAEQRIATLAAALGLTPSTAGAAAAAAVRDPAAEVQQLEQPAAAAAAAAAAVAGAGPGSESPAVGESSAAQGVAMVADQSASGATPMEREQQAQQAQQEQQEQQAQQAQQEQQVGAVDVVAASGAGADSDPQAARRPARINSGTSDGSDRPGLKRDRSKVYAPVAKRRDRDAPRVLKTSPAPQAQPASSGSSMQVSQSGTGTGAGQEDSAASGQRRTIMQRTKAALQLWKALRTNVSTPSTVAMQQPNLQPSAEQQ